MLEIFTDIEQGTDAWRRARMGIPTASSFATVMAKGRSCAESITRRKYLLGLAGEILTGEPMEGFTSAHMDRGHRLEEEARDFYALVTNTTPQTIGFIRNGQKGCSPDALVGEDGAIEIKTALPSILIEIILKGEFPPEHKAQCQGVLWVGEREWVDLIVYWPNLPPFIRRAHRDEAYIADLTRGVEQFNNELADTVEKIRAMGHTIGAAA